MAIAPSILYHERTETAISRCSENDMDRLPNVLPVITQKPHFLSCTFVPRRVRLVESRLSRHGDAPRCRNPSRAVPSRAIRALRSTILLAARNRMAEVFAQIRLFPTTVRRYHAFTFDRLSDEEILKNFRFRREDLPRLKRCLEIAQNV
ncbi:unnamed protein product [Nesidiocoris tenuis]|uniref:Uncharacterized protein n=1 Tax=Nesidiocoris tenuis TaxID=355587 RepID=A0A6H5GSQ2_9HEMI|nr:unnamed protein product [Nesidiocoris tenuis]